MSKNNLGWSAVFFVALIPVALWLTLAPHGPLAGTTIILDDLARMLALTGLSLFSLTVILAGRVPIFEKLFHGLDKTYRAHHTLGAITLVLLLLHSSLLILKYSLISLPAGYDFLLSFHDIALLVGKLTMIAFVSLMIVALYIYVKYEWFILTMRALGILVFFAGYHALFVDGSDVRQTPVLFAYMLFIGGGACLVYVYKSIFHKSIKRQYKYEISEVQQLNDVTTIWLKPLGRSMQYYAGQFAFIRVTDGHVRNEEHPFTISSGSSESDLRFCIKASGDFTSTLPNLKGGDKVQVEGPYGEFSFTKMPNTKQFWVAGGIGITPFLSMARSLPNNGYDIHLYYSLKTQKEAVFLPELNEIAKRIPHFHITPIITDKQGFVTAELVAKDVDLNKSDVLLCGPPSMMHALSGEFQKLGVNPDNIHYEEFSL